MLSHAVAVANDASAKSFGSYLPYLVQGFLVTLKVFALGSLVWIPAAFVLAAGRMARWRVVRFGAGFIVELFRGSSALVQLFWAYFVLPFAGIYLSPLTAAILVLGLNEGSYAAEIVRGAVKAVAKGQRDAAMALGLSSADRFRFVIFPEAVTIMLPNFGNAAIDFLKGTSLVSLVTVTDLIFRGQLVQSATGDTGQVYALLLVVYFATSLVIATGFRAIESWIRVRRDKPRVQRRSHGSPRFRLMQRQDSEPTAGATP